VYGVKRKVFSALESAVSASTAPSPRPRAVLSAPGPAQDDVRALINLVNAVFAAADARDWDTYRALMLDEVHVDFAGVGPHRPGPASADDLARRTREALAPVQLTQHALTGHTVAIDGDRARVTCYEKALTTIRPWGPTPGRTPGRSSAGPPGTPCAPPAAGGSPAPA
jgi:SnoaL-like domain